MQWEKSDVEKAFEIFLELLHKQKIDQMHAHYDQYHKWLQQYEVKEIVRELIEEKANVTIFLSREVIYLVPNIDNKVFTYNNQELRDRMKLKTNKELYLAHFTMLVLLSKFYNSEHQTFSTRSYVTIEELIESVDYYVEEFSKKEQNIEEMSDDYDLDIQGIIESWKSLAVFDEKAKKIEMTHQNKVGFLLNKVLRFMKEEELIFLRDKKEIELTEKMEQIINNYYFNSYRKEQLMALLAMEQEKGEG